MSELRRVAAVTMILLAVGGIGAAFGMTAPGAKCAAKKLRLAGKKYAAFAICDWKVVPSGAPVSSDCLASASGKFATGWQKVEAKGGCATVGDHDAIEQRIDDGRLALETLLGPGPSRCAADRYRAAGREGRCNLKCAARLVQSDAPDAGGNFNDCVAACDLGFTHTFADASDHGDCGASPGVSEVQTAVEGVVTDVVAALQPDQATTTTTSTTSTTLAPVCGNGVVEAPEACDGTTCPPEPYPFYPDGCNDACQCCARDSVCYARGFGILGELRIPCCPGLHCIEPPIEFGPNATGSCYRSCTQPADCSPPYLCFTGTCLQPCAQDSDCVPPEYFCYQGVCLR